MNNNRLTLQEELVLNTLAKAWNRFLELPEQHPDHNREFRDAIHAAERLILCRPTSRAEGLVKTSPPEPMFAEYSPGDTSI